MTSSLVGSEMCIRDRDWVGSPPFACAAGLGQENPTHKQKTREHLTPTTPVSYTHLTLPTICSV
eukprot:2740833-Prorocentrum_lima.AAC.1